MRTLSFDGCKAVAEKGAELLYRRGARRVWLVGSLAMGRRRDVHSDIDFAVDGLPPGQQRAALKELIRTLQQHVNLIELETAVPNLRQHIMRYRILIQRRTEKPGTPAIKGDGTFWAAREKGRSVRPLYDQRLESVMQALAARGGGRLIDLGCGRGRLLGQLAASGAYEALAGVDLSEFELKQARRLLRRSLKPAEFKMITLFQGLLTFRDPRLLGYDTATATEVIEHLDLPRRLAFEQVVFEFMQTRTVVITTPNREYNINWRSRAGSRTLRHPGHHFEWTQQQFWHWAQSIANRYGYDVHWAGIGQAHANYGPPSQMVVFWR
ncbi:MAG: methyltransferase domain-containing protein [Deltaproteobacteria bacterium]|nr:methyltransferase domain-containing protein [Deltaproteobacteria bacterium]